MRSSLSPEKALKELRHRAAMDPLAYARTTPSHNVAQIRLIDAVSRGDPMTWATFGNGTGKTHALVSIWSALMFGTKNPLFQGGVFKQWPKRWPKTCRLCAPAPMLEDEGIIQALMRKLFPSNAYRQHKNHKTYNAQGRTNTGWTWDVMTYDQAATQAAGETKGLLLYSEPPPQALFDENMARLRAGGMLVGEMTPLTFAAYILDDYLDIGVLRNEEGEEVGKINHVTGDIWDNCDEKPGGQLSRVGIEITIAGYTDEMRELRKSGMFGRLQGRIYKQFVCETHVISQLEPYHADCFEKGKYTLYNVVDPHDRKPFAVGWYAVFPNDDIVVMGEFPDASMQPFHKISSCAWMPHDYASMMMATERQGFGRPADVRWIDPNFGQTTQFATKMSIRQTFFKWGQDPAHVWPLNYGLPADSINDGHLAVKGWLGDAEKGVRPKLYVMESCANHVFGFTHYAWKENRDSTKGQSETPQLVYKDFMDLVRYLCLMQPRYVEPLPKERADLYKRASYPGRR